MTSSEEAFSLVKDFADELSRGDVALPSLPQAVIRLRSELGKPGFDVAQLARLAGTEPALAGSILNMANSVTYSRAGKETLDLKVAIPRIGAGKVQALAVRFAMQQIKNSSELGRSRKLLEREWALGQRVAAACYLVAERSKKSNPDEALVVGLIHNIGRLYLYSRADKYPGLFDSPAVLEELVDSWHANIACAIVESWGLPPEAIEAVTRQSDEDDGPPCGVLTYVLRIGLEVARLDSEPTTEQLVALAQRRFCRTLGLGAAELGVISEARETTRLDLGLTD